MRCSDCRRPVAACSARRLARHYDPGDGDPRLSQVPGGPVALVPCSQTPVRPRCLTSVPNLEDVRTRGVAVGRRLSPLAGASILACDAVYSASRHLGTAFHTVNGVGSHDQIDFGGQSHGPFTRCLRFAAFLPASRSYGHARLAFGRWSTFAGRAFQLARSLVKFPPSLHCFLLTQAMPGALPVRLFLSLNKRKQPHPPRSIRIY